LPLSKVREAVTPGRVGRYPGEAVKVRVRDNGTGIPSEISDQLFQPFFTTKPTGEGTGLGLSISWDIVTQQHGARLPSTAVRASSPVYNPSAAQQSGRREQRMSVNEIAASLCARKKQHRARQCRTPPSSG